MSLFSASEYLNSGFKLFIILISSLLLASCLDARHHPYLDVIEATAGSPYGDIELIKREAAEWRGSSYDAGENMRMKGSNGNNKAYFEGHGERGRFMFTLGPNWEVIFTEGVKYETNWGRKESLIIIKKDKKKRNGKYLQSIDFTPPARLYSYDFKSHSISNESAEKIRDDEDTIHRFIIPYTIDGKPYVFDTSYKVKVVKTYHAPRGFGM